MPMCQAFGCSNRPGCGEKKSFFAIPNPDTDRERCAKWLNNIGTDKYDVKSYKYVINRVVCEDHFKPECFLEDIRAKVMGYVSKRKLLKPDAIPTLFNHRSQPRERESSRVRRQQTDRRQSLQNILHIEAPSTSNAGQTCPDLTVPVDDPHDADVSDVLDFATLSDQDPPEVLEVTETPEPCQFITLITRPKEKRRNPILDDNPRKRKRRRRQSGHGKRMDSATQTPHRAYINASAQTEAECYDYSTQVPEPDVTSPSPFDHQYAASIPDTSSIVEINIDSVLQEETNQDSMQSIPDDPDSTIIVTPALTEPVPILAQVSTVDQTENHKLGRREQHYESTSTPTSFEGSARAAESSLGLAPIPLVPPTSRSAPSSHDIWSQQYAHDPRPSVKMPPPVRDETNYSSGDATSANDSLGLLDNMNVRRDSLLLPPPAPVAEISSHARTLPTSQGPASSHSDPASSSANERMDPTYVPSSDASTSSDPEEETWLKYCVDPKYVVFGSQIDQVLYSLVCSKCDGGHISELKKHVQGTMLSVSVICVCGNIVKHWESQPTVGHASVGNLLCSASALFSGQTFESLDFFSNLLNLEFIGSTQYYDFHDQLFYSAINSAFKSNIAEARGEFGEEPIIVCGDGRCDSPGYNAKYCSYTLMESSTNKILAMALVQVSETTSSNAMEKLGFQRAIQELLEAGVNVATVATDRHLGIRKFVREEYPEMQHQFDVWHMTKSISKKLLAKSKKKECGNLGPWVKCITNHLWWCASNCEEDDELLIEMWQSITHHICNIHEWNSGNKFHKCAHQELEPDEGRKTKWLTPDSPAHQALQDVLFDRTLVKDIRQLTKACRTGELESFHNMLLKYCPKRKHYHYPGMLARLQLAVLDHNNNTARQQAKVKQGPRKGEGQVAFRYSKRSRTWVVKMIKEKKNHSYLVDILQDVLRMKSGELEVEEVELPNLPRNVAPVPCPPKEELLARRYSRFKP